jgi:exonuclease V gamma subunit
MTFKQLKPPAKSNKQVQEYIQAVEKGMNNYFVVHKDKGWYVQKASHNKSGQLFETKTEALSKAKELASEKKSQVFIFNSSGKFTRP